MSSVENTTKIIADFLCDKHELALKLSKLLVEKKDMSKDDKNFFTAAINAALYFGVRQTTITKRLGVGSGTVSRWASGNTCPHKFARPAVIEEISALVVEANPPTRHSGLMRD